MRSHTQAACVLLVETLKNNESQEETFLQEDLELQHSKSAVLRLLSLFTQLFFSLISALVARLSRHLHSSCLKRPRLLFVCGGASISCDLFKHIRRVCVLSDW